MKNNNKLFNEWALKYDNDVMNSEQKNQYPFKGYQDVIKGIYNTVISSKCKKVLDMGCGTGFLSEMFYHDNINVTLADFSSEMLNIASKKMPNSKTYLGSFDEVYEELKGQKFDAIIFTYSIHHITLNEQVALLEKLKKILSINGVIIIGDVLTKTKNDLLVIKDEFSTIWDDDEFYPVADYLTSNLNDLFTIKEEYVTNLSGYLVFENKITTDDLKEIGILRNIEVINKINLGWSTDTKYYIKANNVEYLLRVNDISKYDSKVNEFNLMKKIWGKGINMSEPLLIGTILDEKYVFILLSYLKGEQAEESLLTYDLDTQYSLGIKAGSMLKKIHEIKPEEEFDFADTYTKKIHARIKMFKECGYQNKKVDEMIDYVLSNLSLLEKRPVCLHHGDFHVGNMIISDKDNIGIIDFNRLKFGDPLYEFNRLYFSFRISKVFSKGILDGYFDKQYPMNINEIIKFYISSVVIASIPWSLMFDSEDVDFAINSINELYEEMYNNNLEIENW